MSCNYLITGASGQLGSAFKRYINRQSGCAAYSSDCDINNIDQLSVSLTNKFSTIINFAGIASVRICDEQPVDCYETNTFAIRKILQILKSINFRGQFVNLGSINEFVPEKRLSVYSKTKVRAREIISEFRKGGLDCHQYTIGLSISPYKTANIGTAMQKILAIAENCRNAIEGIKAEPVKTVNIGDAIRISSCDATAASLFSFVSSGEKREYPYFDADPIPFSYIIHSILDSADGLSWSVDRDGYYVWPQNTKLGEPVKVVSSITLPKDSTPSISLQPSYTIPPSYHAVVREITQAVINRRYPLNTQP